MSGLVPIAVNISFGLIILSILLGFYRLARGPSLADRVVALDMMTVSIVAFCALFAIRTDDTVFLDIALVLALVGFLATVALARFAERGLEKMTGKGDVSFIDDASNTSSDTDTEQDKEPAQS
ncbi:MAG: cation:proton antiporter [Pseudomonadota bacterium]